jgi:hypothetical protein
MKTISVAQIQPMLPSRPDLENGLLTEAQSADPSIAWAVRPREPGLLGPGDCNKASSAESAMDTAALKSARRLAC